MTSSLLPRVPPVSRKGLCPHPILPPVFRELCLVKTAEITGNSFLREGKKNLKKAQKKVAAQLREIQLQTCQDEFVGGFGVKLAAACWWWIRCQADIRNLKANRVRVV